MDRTVAVTGGSKLGRAVVAALIEEGWTVVNSIATLAGHPAHFIRADLTDYGQGQRSSRLLLIMEWSPRSAAPMPAATRRTLPSRLEPKPRRRPLG